jgi:hypothetical protein
MPTHAHATAAGTPDVASGQGYIHKGAVGTIVVVTPDQAFLIGKHGSSTCITRLRLSDPFGRLADLICGKASDTRSLVETSFVGRARFVEILGRGIDKGLVGPALVPDVGQPGIEQRQVRAGIVTASYWGFTLTDGALRMLVLFHFFRLGYTPFTLAFLFLLYEAAGIGANLAGGYFASPFGIPRMLAIGQILQISGLLMLSALQPAWGAVASVVWVVIAEGIAGVAKDLTKTASKSAIKATSAEGNGQLFRWVAWFTGSKNAMKGGLLLDLVGFRSALWIMAALLGIIFVAGLLLLPRQLGKAKSSKTMRELFAKSRAINLLAAARIFMFGARDVWFVVGFPVFLYAYGWKFLQVSGFLAAWTIAYGGIQAVAPALVSSSLDGLSRELPSVRLWALVLAAIPITLAAILNFTDGAHPEIVLLIGLSFFWPALRGELFAAFLSHPRLCGIRKGRRRRRLLLCCQCRRTSARYHPVRCSLSVRRNDGLLGRFGSNAAALHAHYVSASDRGIPVGSSRATGLNGTISEWLEVGSRELSHPAPFSSEIVTLDWAKTLRL